MIRPAIYPLGTAIISDKISEVINESRCEGGAFTMAFTYSGHPIDCATSLRILKL